MAARRRPTTWCGRSSPMPSSCARPMPAPAAARNRGLRHATGELVTFLDSDDRWADNALARLAKGFADAPGRRRAGSCPPLRDLRARRLRQGAVARSALSRLQCRGADGAPRGAPRLRPVRRATAAQRGRRSLHPPARARCPQADDPGRRPRLSPSSGVADGSHDAPRPTGVLRRQAGSGSCATTWTGAVRQTPPGCRAGCRHRPDRSPW